MRLAFQHFGGSAWEAGNALIENMFLALRTLGNDCPVLLLVVDHSSPERDYGGLAAIADQVVRAQVRATNPGLLLQRSLRYHSAWWLRTHLLKLPARVPPHPLAKVFRAQQVDAYFTLAWTELPVSSVPSVVWLPDFQHQRLPDNFEPGERADRDHLYALLARGAARLLVTSEEVYQDLKAFAPAEASKARRIPFVAHVPPEVYDQDPRDSLASYHLPEKFVYLPNQFWQHKNHRLVFEALGRLRTRGTCVCVVSSGSPLDYRHPMHFTDLMESLSRLNIRDQFIYLGQVPRADVFRLMRQAVCVLNPSLFEGLGLSVAESKSLGKRVVVSDLAPHREQDAPGALYFDPGDADDLANKLEMVWAATAAGPDRPLEAAARAALPGRQAAFGRALVQVFEEAQADFKSQASAV